MRVTFIKLEAFTCRVVWKLVPSLTECDAVHCGSLGVRQIPVHLLDDLLLHLGDAVAVQDFDRGHIGTLAVNQHL